MCDTIYCDRCEDTEADTDFSPYTNNYSNLCISCASDDQAIKELDDEISTILDLLEEKPSNYSLAVDLKHKQDELNEILNTW